MAGRLAGKVAIVTGAGSSGPGIGNGRATAVLFAREGAKVCLVDNHLERATETLEMIVKERLSEGLGEEAAFATAADVTVDADCKRVVDETMARFGRVDILDNNVGIGMGNVSVVTVTEENWDRVMTVNVKSMVLMSKHAIPAMRGERRRCHHQHLVAVGAAAAGADALLDVEGRRDRADEGDGCRPRAGQHPRQLHRAGPGLTRRWPGPGMTEERRALRAKTSPLSSEGHALDIAWAAVYLAGDESRWVTGQVLTVDGGLSLVAPAR